MKVNLTSLQTVSGNVPSMIGNESGLIIPDSMVLNEEKEIEKINTP